MATTEELFLPYLAITVLDDTGTPLTKIVTTQHGGWSLSNYRPGYLNESIDTETNGAHKSNGPGKRFYPEITIAYRVDEFQGASADTLIDMFRKTAAGTYAAAVNTDANSPNEHRHLKLDYARPVSADTQSIECEDCEWMPGDVAGDDSVVVAVKLKIKGRVMMNGIVTALEYGGSTTPPGWV